MIFICSTPDFGILFSWFLFFFSRVGEGNQKRPSKLGRKLPNRKWSESRHVGGQCFFKDCAARTTVEPTSVCGEISLIGPELQNMFFPVSREKIHPSLTRGGVAAHLAPDGLLPRAASRERARGPQPAAASNGAADPKSSGKDYSSPQTSKAFSRFLGPQRRGEPTRGPAPRASARSASASAPRVFA